MVRIYRWFTDSGAEEFAVYRGEKLVRVCPSLGMAREVAAGL
jgi:hypothetical protein